MDLSNKLPSQNVDITDYQVPANKTNPALIIVIVVLLMIIVGGGGFILTKYLYSPFKFL